LLIKHNIYFVANPVAVVNPMNWGRLRLRRCRAEDVPERAPPRRKYEKINLLIEILANCLLYIKFLERARIEVASLPPAREIPIVEILSGKNIF